MEVVEILKKAIDQNASDIFFVAGSPCMFKVGQQLVKVTQEKMMPNDTKDIVQQLYGFAPYCSYENFVANGEDDFSFSLSQVGRFRVMCIVKETQKLLYCVWLILICQIQKI